MLVKAIADLARPYTLYIVSSASAYAIVMVATQGTDLNAGAVFVGALLAGIGALYWGKAWELRGVAGHTAEVEKARVAAAPPAPGTASIVAAPDVDVTIREAGPDGQGVPDRPAWERS